MKPSHLILLALISIFAVSACKKNKFEIQGNFQDALENPFTWFFADDEGLQCRDGSETGMMIRLNPASPKLLIYLMGGGACFNGPTCDANPDFFGPEAAQDWADAGGNSGVFNMNNNDNPFRDWSVVVIPYCTGDLHAGFDGDKDVDGGPKGQVMVGYNNLSIALLEIDQYFGGSGLDEIFVTGSSAGGFGVMLGFEQVAGFFPDVPVNGLNDGGGFPVDDTVIPDCFATFMEDQMGLKFPFDFEDHITGYWGTGMKGMYEYLANKRPNSKIGIASHYEDEVIRWYMGFGQNNCANAETTIDGQLFRDGLIDLRENVFSQMGNWETFFVNGTGHTFLSTDAGLATEAGGKPLYDWINELRFGTAGDESD